MCYNISKIECEPRATLEAVKKHLIATGSDPETLSVINRVLINRALQMEDDAGFPRALRDVPDNLPFS